MHCRMALRLLVLLTALGLAGSATGSPIASITLSDLSSEQSGGPCEPGCTGIPIASQLDATITFTVTDNAGDLDVILTLSNDTTDWKINQVYFNLTVPVANLTAVNLAGWSLSTDGCPVGSTTTGIFPCTDGEGSSTKADGFGIFDVALKTSEANGLANSTSINFAFTVPGGAGTMAEAFLTGTSRDSEAGGLFLSIAAAKFVSGPQVTCPDSENICDSGFGAAGVIPEPTTAILLGAGLLGLIAAGRRR